MYPQKLIQLLHEKALLDHLHSFPAHDKYLRFGYPITAEALDKYVQHSFGEGNQWFVVVGNAGNVVASVHVAMINERRAEMGLTVDHTLRGQGIGQLLFDRGLSWARSRGARQIFLQCLSENKVMQHIARKNNMTVTTLEGSEREGVLKFSSPSLIAPYTEVAMDQMAMVDAALRYQKNMLMRALEFWL